MIDGHGTRWRADNSRVDRRRGECGASLRRAQRGSLGYERYDDELQSDQRAGRRPDDDIEAVPSVELRHIHLNEKWPRRTVIDLRQM